MPSSSRSRRRALRLAAVLVIGLTAACGSGPDEPVTTGTAVAPAATEEVPGTAAPQPQAPAEQAPPAPPTGAPQPVAGAAAPQPQAPAHAPAPSAQPVPAPAPAACPTAAEAMDLGRSALGEPVVSASAPECADGWATSLLAVGESQEESLTMPGVFRSEEGAWAWSDRDQACASGHLPGALRAICDGG